MVIWVKALRLGRHTAVLLGVVCISGSMSIASPSAARDVGRIEPTGTARVAFPLKVSANGRYLVDQHNAPFMIVGDSPQAMIGDLSVEDAGTFIADRKTAGFNSLWVNLLCNKGTGCREDGSTFDGIKPFLKAGDLSTPNPAYFARAGAIIRLAAKANLVVFLDPSETAGWLTVLRNNGIAKSRAYGRFSDERTGTSEISCGLTETISRLGTSARTTQWYLLSQRVFAPRIPNTSRQLSATTIRVAPWMIHAGAR